MTTPRRAKIVCTLGPATRSEEMISRLIGAGADVIRLNFSHGLHEEHGAAIRHIRRIAEKKGKPVAILQDLQGPKVRVGDLKEKSIQLKRGKLLTILPRPIPGTEEAISTTHPELHKKVRPGDAIMMNDGAIELRVLRIEDEKIVCRVIGGGTLQAYKGINVPGRDLGFPSLTAKDRADLKFGLAHGVDFVALSMVRRAEDLLTIKRLILREKKDVPVIAKLEQAMAIDHLDEIIKVADGVMVARGDLGVEIPLEQVPLLQKEIIKKANDAQIPVITATQMLESMVERPRPTRAEASDVANAIIDGTDAVMLSAETAAGNYPVESVKTMARIIVAAERRAPVMDRRLQQGLSVARAVSSAACQLAWQMSAKAIVTSTLTGGAALRLSKYRPTNPILAFTPHPEIERRMSLYWGVTPRRMPLLKNTDDIFKEFIHAVTQSKEVKRGDLLVMVSKSPWVGSTINDLIKVHQIE
ncbi:MAG: pyruvate kinase [Candidatus Manganitrophus sp. SA1]|nr:pyruvate kinase [Candidatus Manganitrophus morganii]